MVMDKGMTNKEFKLFGISFITLFLEISLIRLISTEVRVFAYVSNLVILACFLGIGIGCYLSKKNYNVLITVGVLVFVSFVIYSSPFQKITEMFSGFSDSVIWELTKKPDSFTSLLSAAVLTLFMYLIILTAFIPLGQIAGRLLNEHDNIVRAYTINILGSLIGVWFFNMLSFIYTPPWVWFTISLSVLIFFVPKNKIYYLAVLSACVLIAVVLNTGKNSLQTLWSPYQKLDIYSNGTYPWQNGYILRVNNTHYMGMLDLSNEQNIIYNQYVMPYYFSVAKDDVLIVGAGGGNDVAGALRMGAKKIDAVEIDPGIILLGSNLHPEQPYRDKRVNVIIEDARAFFKKASGKYNIISLGLLDSHTLSSAYNNIRLDHYVYTEESFREAKKLLKKDGIITVSFAAEKSWIGSRLYGLLKKVFGDVPYVFRTAYSDSAGTTWGCAMFITGENINKLKEVVESNSELKNYLQKSSIIFLENVKLTTDDWPYLYLQKPMIPKMHLLIILSILLSLIIAKRISFGLGKARIDMHFFLLGSAFLLLEFQNIGKSSLLFGSTWIVNSYTISAILVLGLLANIFVIFYKIKNIRFFYVLLLSFIIALYFIPLSVFNNFGYWTKSLLAVAVLNIPIFFAGVIFIDSFKKVSRKNVAFGSNILGAAIGGILASLSFIIGVNALLIIVFFLYIGSFFYLPK